MAYPDGSDRNLYYRSDAAGLGHRDRHGTITGGQMKNLLIIRGLPGSGKTRLAKSRRDELILSVFHCETDQFFVRLDPDGQNGLYCFEPARLGEAHTDCQLKAARAMEAGIGLVIVSNTFSQHWEWQIYVYFAKLFGYNVEVIDLFDAGLTDEELAARCLHGVPVETIQKMRARWEP